MGVTACLMDRNFAVDKLLISPHISQQFGRSKPTSSTRQNHSRAAPTSSSSPLLERILATILIACSPAEARYALERPQARRCRTAGCRHQAGKRPNPDTQHASSWSTVSVSNTSCTSALPSCTARTTDGSPSTASAAVSLRVWEFRI